jgi:hypothetical protein
MPTGLDEQYTWMSLVTLIGFVMIALDIMVARRTALASAGARSDTLPAAGPSLGSAEDEAESKNKPGRAEQPIWRARLERRISGGRRHKRH